MYNSSKNLRILYICECLVNILIKCVRRRRRTILIGLQSEASAQMKPVSSSGMYNELIMITCFKIEQTQFIPVHRIHIRVENILHIKASTTHCILEKKMSDLDLLHTQTQLYPLVLVKAVQLIGYKSQDAVSAAAFMEHYGSGLLTCTGLKAVHMGFRKHTRCTAMSEQLHYNPETVIILYLQY